MKRRSLMLSALSSSLSRNPLTVMSMKIDTDIIINRVAGRKIFYIEVSSHISEDIMQEFVREVKLMHV